MIRAAMLDKSYEATRLGAIVHEYLAWKRLSRVAERTLDQYERDLARLCIECADLDITQFTVAELDACAPEVSARFLAACASGLEWLVHVVCPIRPSRHEPHGLAA